jgi:hypothetical protein
MPFTTTNVPFATYLIAAQKLKLLRIEATPTTATLVFDDPNNEGTSLELAFLSDQALVPARAYNAQFRALRRSVEIKLAEARQSAGVSRA